MGPLGIVLATAAGGFGVLKAVEYFKAKKNAASLPQPVSQLQKGKTYAVTVAVADSAPGVQQGDLGTTSANIKGAFDQTGFTVISMPAPRPDMRSWAFNAQWNLDQPIVTAQLPAWVGQTIVYDAMGTGG